MSLSLFRDQTIIGLALAAAAIFVLDLSTPVGVSTGYLYPILIIAMLWVPKPKTVLVFGILTTVLSLVGFLLRPGDPFASAAPIVNRGLSILGIWAAVILVMKFRTSLQALHQREAELSLAEQKVKAREAHIHSILETAPEAIITINQQGIIESFSAAAERQFGYSAAEIIGKNVSLLMPSPDRERHNDYIARYLRTNEKRIIGIGRVVNGRKKDGTIFPIELAVGEIRLNGERVFTGFIRDLTARQRMEQELRQSQKMEAIGQLAGGIAHDFNNLLTVILGNLEMLEGRIGKDARAKALISDALETVELGAQLTERLLAFGRRQPLNPQAIDLKQLIPDVAELLRRTLGENIEIKTRFDEHVHDIVADPTQLQNALLNLALNARDAMPKGGVIIIEASDSEIDADYVHTHSGMRQGRYVVLSVTDTGTGMTPEVREHALEPFFTTKPPGSGTGLGLSMVYGFAKQSGGDLQIYSEAGRGTTIRLYLPQVVESGQTEMAALEEKIDSYIARGEKILVVEDEERVRRIATSRLLDLGYTVLEAEDGPKALRLMQNEPNIDLLFTDMIMPGGMTGADLAERVRALRPEVKILFTSGYAEPDLLQKGVQGDANWLRKPYTSHQLARRLREVLET